MSLAALKRIIAQNRAESGKETQKDKNRVINVRKGVKKTPEYPIVLPKHTIVRLQETFTAPTIVVNNSYCSVYALPQEVVRQITELLTYHNENVTKERAYAFKLLSKGKETNNGIKIEKALEILKDTDGTEYVCWFQDERFPTGHLNLVKDFLLEMGFEYRLDDRRRHPTKFHDFHFRNRPHDPRYYQENMIALGVEHGRGVFVSAVGTGKSLVLTYLLRKLQVTSLIILPGIALLEQTLMGLTSAFGRRNITVVNSGMVKKGEKLAPIRLTTIQTLASLQKQGLLHLLVTDVDMLAVDEIHHAASKSFLNLLPEIDHIYYRFGFTGTFCRPDGKTLDLWGFLSNVLYTYTAVQATEEEYLTPVEFHIHTLQGKAKKHYPTEYRVNYCGSKVLLYEIHKILHLLEEEKQVLILVDRKDTAGKVIHEYLTDQGYENVYISGDDKKGEIAKAITGFNEKKIRILVGSQVLGEGIDLYSTDILILARGGKSEIAIPQAIGRAIRLAPGKKLAIVHDMRFTGTNYMEKHLEMRLELYRESFGGIIKEVKI